MSTWYEKYKRGSVFFGCCATYFMATWALMGFLFNRTESAIVKQWMFDLLLAGLIGLATILVATDAYTKLGEDLRREV